MPVSLTICDIPDSTLGELAARASRAGSPLQECIRGQLIAIAARPDPQEWWSRVESRVQTAGLRFAAADIMEARDEDRR